MTALCLSIYGQISLHMFNFPMSETFHLKIQKGSIYNCRCVLVVFLLCAGLNVHWVEPASGLSVPTACTWLGKMWAASKTAPLHCCAYMQLADSMASLGLCVALNHGWVKILTEMLWEYLVTWYARGKVWRMKELDLRVLSQSISCKFCGLNVC